MWEWRIFGPGERIVLPDPVLAYARKTRRTRDTYLALGDPAIGLRISVEDGDARCVLKRRFESDPLGLERWEKLLARRFPLGRLGVLELTGHLGLDARRAPRRLRSPRDLTALLDDAGLSPRRVKVRKKVVVCASPPALKVELADVRVTEPDGDENAWRSASVEAPTREICRAHMDAIGFPRVWALPSDLVVGGYPTLLERLARPSRR